MKIVEKNLDDDNYILTFQKSDSNLGNTAEVVDIDFRLLGSKSREKADLKS